MITTDLTRDSKPINVCETCIINNWTNNNEQLRSFDCCFSSITDRCTIDITDTLMFRLSGNSSVLIETPVLVLVVVFTEMTTISRYKIHLSRFTRYLQDIRCKSLPLPRLFVFGQQVSGALSFDHQWFTFKHKYYQLRLWSLNVTTLIKFIQESSLTGMVRLIGECLLERLGTDIPHPWSDIISELFNKTFLDKLVCKRKPIKPVERPINPEHWYETVSDCKIPVCSSMNATSEQTPVHHITIDGSIPTVSTLANKDSRTFGRLVETAAIDYWDRICKQKGKRQKRLVWNIPTAQLSIVGVVDGLYEDHVAEIKSRTTSLSAKSIDRDLLQTFVYLLQLHHLGHKVEVGKLVEFRPLITDGHWSKGVDLHSALIDIHKVTRNPLFTWSTISEQICKSWLHCWLPTIIQWIVILQVAQLCHVDLNDKSTRLKLQTDLVWVLMDNITYVSL